SATVVLRHNKVDLALHRLRDGEGRPLLHLHGLGERSPERVPDHLEPWPGPVWALDFTGHGESTVPTGGGYYCDLLMADADAALAHLGPSTVYRPRLRASLALRAAGPRPVGPLDFTGHGESAVPTGGGYYGELLMADADAALAHLGPSTVYGRGLGAYVALLVAGARPELVRGAILDDGPGLHGGGPEPAGVFVLPTPLPVTGPPDPYALLELGRDVRPPDYAATYARQAATLSGLHTAIAVVAVARPPWLEAVADEPGVRVVPRAACTEPFATV